MVIKTIVLTWTYPISDLCWCTIFFYDFEIIEQNRASNIFSIILKLEQNRAPTKIRNWKSPCQNISFYNHLPPLLLIFPRLLSSYLILHFDAPRTSNT